MLDQDYEGNLSPVLVVSAGMNVFRMETIFALWRMSFLRTRWNSDLYLFSINDHGDQLVQYVY